MGQPVPATGFSIGVSRLMTALKNLGKLGQNEVIEPVLVPVMDGDIDAMGRYQKMTQELRAAGIRAEMYQGNWKKFGNQLKYADRRGCPIAIIQGGDRRAEVCRRSGSDRGQAPVGEIEDNVAWREARVAQESVPEKEFVAKVREILAAGRGSQEGGLSMTIVPDTLVGKMSAKLTEGASRAHGGPLHHALINFQFHRRSALEFAARQRPA